MKRMPRGRSDLDCFIQVSLDDDAGAHRGGANPSDVEVLAGKIESAEGLRLAGLMAVAPLGGLIRMPRLRSSPGFPRRSAPFIPPQQVFLRGG